LLNYAVSGAKSTSGNYDAWLDYIADTGLTAQIDTFDATLKGRSVDPHALLVVSFSANDYFQFHDFRKAVHHPVRGEPALEIELLAERVARNVCAGVERLIAHGARRIIVFSSYALAQSPLVSIVDPQGADAKRFTDRFDARLTESVPTLRKPHVQLTIFPIGDQMRSIIAQHPAFIINDVVHPCQITIPKEEPACQVPDDFFWWDELHPTRHTHQILGDMLFDSMVSGRDQ
jgi:phospholipase/lecithinase/hemolysin